MRAAVSNMCVFKHALKKNIIEHDVAVRHHGRKLLARILRARLWLAVQQLENL